MKWREVRILMLGDTAKVEYRGDNINRVEPEQLHTIPKPLPHLGRFYYPVTMSDEKALIKLRSAMMRYTYDQIDVLNKQYDKLLRLKH
jgi:hypothetical protein